MLIISGCSSLCVLSSSFVFPFLQEDMALPMFQILMHLFAMRYCLRRYESEAEGTLELPVSAGKSLL